MRLTYPNNHLPLIYTTHYTPPKKKHIFLVLVRLYLCLFCQLWRAVFPFMTCKAPSVCCYISIINFSKRTLFWDGAKTSVRSVNFSTKNKTKKNCIAFFLWLSSCIPTNNVQTQSSFNFFFVVSSSSCLYFTLLAAAFIYLLVFHIFIFYNIRNIIKKLGVYRFLYE